jgi:molybdopterin molybdotransferase
LLTIEEARAKILADLQALGGESVPLPLALGRVPTHDVHAKRLLPGFDNSAMDGYAVRALDLASASAAAPVSLRVAYVVGAGALAPRTLASGEAARIFTGAPVPEGCDAVVMQEDTDAQDSNVRVRVAPKPGAHIRRAGEDLRPGDLVARAGDLLGPGDLGALAAQGITTLEVTRRPRVSIVPTGDELVDISREPGPGQVPNSNAYLLAAQVTAAGGVPDVMPPVADDPQQLRDVLRRAAQSSDLVLTSGGVSVGDFDFVRDVAQEQGALSFWKVAMKPGKPLAYGRLLDRPFLGLPGNPVSSFVCFVLFAGPALRRLGGLSSVEPARELARLVGTLRPDKARRELVRARTSLVAGALAVNPVGRRGSHQLSSLLQINALIDLAPGTEDLAEGCQVQIIRC